MVVVEENNVELVPPATRAAKAQKSQIQRQSFDRDQMGSRAQLERASRFPRHSLSVSGTLDSGCDVHRLASFNEWERTYVTQPYVVFDYHPGDASNFETESQLVQVAARHSLSFNTILRRFRAR